MGTYRVLAPSGSRVRSAPGLHGAVLATLPLGTLVQADRVAVGPEDIPGYDDPTTPEPARRTNGWAHLIAPVVGYAALAWLEEVHGAPLGDYTPQTLTVRHAPRITEATFTRVLEGARSPAAAEAAACYAACVAAGCDPAVALAFFGHESTYGTAGLAVRTKNWGNLRRGRRGVVRPTATGPFAFYATWTDSLRDWCDLLAGPVYAGDGLHTVGQILPRYAPSSDGNAPARYAQAVCDSVNRWVREEAAR